MNRTAYAVVVAALIGLVAIGGLAFLLGFPPGASIVGGLVGAVVLGGIVLAAAARAGEFDEVTAPKPRHPGPPPPPNEEQDE